MCMERKKKKEETIMPSLVATTSTPARKPFVRTHYVRTNRIVIRQILVLLFFIPCVYTVSDLNNWSITLNSTWQHIFEGMVLPSKSLNLEISFIRFTVQNEYCKFRMMILTRYLNMWLLVMILNPNSKSKCENCNCWWCLCIKLQEFRLVYELMDKKLM